MSTYILGLQAHPQHKETFDASARSQRLKAATHAAHEALDTRIMAARPFKDRHHYGRFLRMQYRFHRDLNALYESPLLSSVIVGLNGRNRMESVTTDLRDLQIPAPDPEETNVLSADSQLATCLGWLYVAEGSKLGAAILFKLAAGLGLDETFGARHLAGHPDGRAHHWREFVAVLDGVSLSPSQEQQVIDGAVVAFDRARAHLDREFSG